MKYIHLARESVTFYDFEISPDLQDLLAVLIGDGAEPEVCGRLSSYGLTKLSQMSIKEFVDEGLMMNEAIQLNASFILSNKILKEKPVREINKVGSPEDVYEYFNKEFYNLNQEVFITLFLNTKNEIIGRKVITKGTLNATIIHPREVFAEAIKQSSASIIAIHNHPSGCSAPSPEDIEVTKRLVASGELLGIELLDHMIVGKNEFVSLKEKGYM